MAIIEDGDFFVIADEAHIEVMPDGTKVFGSPRFEGMIFEAKKVEVNHVIAKVVEIDQKPDEKDVVLSLNTKNYDIDIVSKEYAEMYANSRRPEGMGTLRDFIGEAADIEPHEVDQFLKNLDNLDFLDGLEEPEEPEEPDDGDVF